MANLIEMVAHHHNIHTILENKVKVSYLDGVTRRSTRMKVEMDTEKDK